MAILSILRATDPPRRISAHLNTIVYEDGTSSQTFFPASEAYFTEHHIPNKKSMFNPPPHIHLYQSEQFLIVKGTGVWHRPTAPRTSERDVVKREGDPPIDLPVGTYHYFENTSETEELVVRIRVDPKGMNAVKEEMFFRNFFGYLDDCRAHGTAPSLFQLELFLDTVGSALAIPVPGPDWVKWWASRGVMVVLGVVIGEWLLGYKRSYPEYYSGKDTGE